MISKECLVHGHLTLDQCYIHRRKARNGRAARTDYECKQCVKDKASSLKAVERRRTWRRDKYRDDPEFRRKKRDSEAARYRQDPEGIGVRVRDWRRALKTEVLSHYANSDAPRCALCGEDVLRHLCLDHLNGDGAEHRRKNLSIRGNSYLWAKKHGFPPIFRTLCHNCNYLASYRPGATSSAEYNRRIKDEVLRYYSEPALKCALCGISDIRILTLDHVNGNGNAHRREVGNGGSRMYRWIRKNGFPTGFRILCFNHNLGKHCLD